MADTFLRQWAMLKLVPHAPRKVDTLKLQSELLQQGFSVDLRTLQRDLKTLSALFPLHCDTRSKPFGWQWMTGGRSLDVPGMSAQTALALKLMDSYLRPLLPRSTLRALEPQLHNANEVLAHLSDQAIRDWPRKVRVLPAGLGFLPPEIDEAVLPVVYEALFTDRRFRARYQARMDHAPESAESYLINPLGLVVRGAVITLVCSLFDDPDLRLLALHHLSEASLTDEPVRLPEGFDLDQYLSQGPFDISAGRLIRLRAVLEKRVAQFIAETPLSQDQRMREREDGRVQLTASLMETEQLRGWLLSLGAQVEVLAPDSLREAMTRNARSVLTRYRGAGKTRR